MAEVISYPKEIAMAFNTISKKRAAIPLFPIRNINLQEKIKALEAEGVGVYGRDRDLQKLQLPQEELQQFCLIHGMGGLWDATSQGLVAADVSKQFVFINNTRCPVLLHSLFMRKHNCLIFY